MTDVVPAPARVLVLGFDAANPDLIRRWTSDGTLPNIRALMDRGLVGESRSIEGFIHATWPSFSTGVGPARHGYHYIAQVEPGTYRYAMQPLRHETFWTRLSRAGRRLAIFDVPLSEPDPCLNGMQVVDWGVIEQWTTLRTSPPVLRDRILANWGRYPLRNTAEDLRRTTRENAALLDVLCRGARTRAEMSCAYLAEGGWDLFLQIFTESHCAGHNMWHLHDSGHPSHDSAIAAAIGDPLRKVYAEIDAAMGRIIAAAGDATILVISAHGMSHWYGSEFALPEILVRLGAMERRPPPPADQGLGAGAIRGARALWHLVPKRFRHRVFELRDRLHQRFRGGPSLPSIEADPARSKCFLIRNGNLSAGIRLNLIGREPSGVLSPGPEADRFVAGLSADLLALIDERTNRPLVQSVRLTRQLHTGPRLDELPDLLVDWNDEVATGNSNHAGGAGATLRIRSPKTGLVVATNDYSRTGDHRIGGIFIAAGPGIRPGQLGREVSVTDFAPTISRILGVELPDVDGRVIPELLPQPGD